MADLENKGPEAPEPENPGSELTVSGVKTDEGVTIVGLKALVEEDELNLALLDIKRSVNKQMLQLKRELVNKLDVSGVNMLKSAIAMLTATVNSANAAIEGLNLRVKWLEDKAANKPIALKQIIEEYDDLPNTEADDDSR